MAGDSEFIQESVLIMKKEETKGDLCKKFRSARRRRQEIRRLRSDTAGSVKKIRNNMYDTSSSSSSASSSSPPSSTMTKSPPSESDLAVSSSGASIRDEEEERRRVTSSSTCASHGWVSIVGRRREMEDTVTLEPGLTPGYDFFGVYDGHGGARVAEACRERMHVVLADVAGGVWPAGQERWTEVMEECFAKVDGEVAEVVAEKESEAAETVGSTAVVAVVGPTQIVVANCGDSRAVMSRGGVPLPLSSDHKV